MLDSGIMIIGFCAATGWLIALIWAMSEYELFWALFVGLGIPSIFGMILIILGLVYGS